MRTSLFKKGYFFASSNDRLYYVSIYGSQYMIVDIDNCVVVEFRLDKKLDVEKISKIIKHMEILGKHELMKIELEDSFGAREVRVYKYEPKKIKVSEKEGGRHISEEVSVC
jgi:hypothetical protein